MARHKFKRTKAAESPRGIASTPPEKRDARLEALARVAKGLPGWKPPAEAFAPVWAVPTIFPLYDRATRVGGHPVARVGLVHGPSGDGKTYFTLGLLKSFIMRDHFASLIDAEFTMDVDWLRKPGMFGEYADSPLFVGKQPQTFEEAVDDTRGFFMHIAAERKRKKIPNETCALEVVDSIAKLVPEDMWTKIKAHGAQGAKGSVDGMGGRGGQIKAAMNAQWLAELTPLLGLNRGALVFIAREREDPDASFWDKRAGQDYKVGGGKGLIFDSSLRVRVTAKDIYDKSIERVVGARHECKIFKTKVSATDSEYTSFAFHTSNGVYSPEGFWRARDVVELARHYGIIKDVAPKKKEGADAKKGSGWVSWAGHRWQGEKRLLSWMALHPEACAEIETLARARFKEDDPSKLATKEIKEDESIDALFQ